VILSNPFNQFEFTKFVLHFLPEFKEDIRKIVPGSSGFTEIIHLGESKILDTSVLVVRSKARLTSRISLTNISFKILKKSGIYRALIVYVNDDETIWRLSLLTATPTFSSGKVIVKYSNPRRHSYVLGTDVGIATARKYLANMGSIKDFGDLEFRFSVEVVNKDFYQEIAEHFYGLVGRYGDSREVLAKPILRLPSDNASNQELQNYSIRLLGRILFLWFLKQKHSLNGLSLLPSSVLERDHEGRSNFHHDVIEPLFFEVLNKPSSDRDQKFCVEPYSQVPYLNGGLFHPTDGESGDFYDEKLFKSKCEIPNSWYKGLFETLNTYNFTIDENLENDVDLSIDPEMLGRVFENLLAEINPETGQIARKSSGSFYTPRVIVSFMVDESLTKFLEEKTGISRERIQALITTNSLEEEKFTLSSDEKSLVVDAISNLKCFDPACGSGAFPISMLHKLLWVISQADPSGDTFLDSEDFAGTEHWLSHSRLDYLRKRKLIRDVIFGVDIQSIAVEIAKLRCFLTLIVDQEIDDESQNRGVIPLPNLDFKFICADSLTPLDENAQMSFGDDPELEKRLLQLRRKYFATTSEEKKRDLRKKFEVLVAPDQKLFAESYRNIQLKTFRPLESNNQAIFFDLHTMFGLENVDLVIGNPPYVNLRDAGYKPLVQHLRSIQMYKYSLGGNLNLYRHFIERSLGFLGEGGILSFIVPSTILADKSSSGIRKMFRDQTLLSFIIEFPEKAKLFESITQATTIFLVTKTIKHDPNEKFYISIHNTSADLPPQTRVNLSWNDVVNLSGPDLAVPLIRDSGEVELIAKLKRGHAPIGSLVRVYTGDIDQTKHAKYMSDTRKNRFLVVGTHVSHFHIDLSTAATKKRWFNYTKDHTFEMHERIVIQGIANMGQQIRIKGSIIPEGVVVGNSTNCIELVSDASSYEYILGILSSDAANWFFRKFSTNNNVNAYEVENIPIAFGNKEQISNVELCVTNLMKLGSNNGEDSRQWDAEMKELNTVINEIYGLSSKELKLIRNS
jgi:Alw26I/Eco31I/Esp3I family type II restriction m6 adenine DNA methyltransferase